MRRIVLMSAAGLALVAGPALSQAPPPEVPPPVTSPVTGALIQDGSWDQTIQRSRGGLPAGWLGLQVKPRKTICFSTSCASYAFKLVATPVREGTRAARFTVKDGDNPFGDSERAEVQGKVTGKPGTIRWYTWSTYLPPAFRFQRADEDHWFFFTQWAVDRGSAPVVMSIHEGQIVLLVNRQAGPNRFIASLRPWGTPVQPLLGQWIDFAVFVRWSPRGDGQIQLWVNGVQQAMNWPFGGDAASFGGAGSYAFTGPTLVPRGGSSFVRQGIVRAKGFPGTSTLVHDALEVHAATAIPVPPPPGTPQAPPGPAPTPTG